MEMLKIVCVDSCGISEQGTARGKTCNSDTRFIFPMQMFIACNILYNVQIKPEIINRGEKMGFS